jgi:hypothetical protein
LRCVHQHMVTSASVARIGNHYESSAFGARLAHRGLKQSLMLLVWTGRRQGLRVGGLSSVMVSLRRSTVR